MFCQQNGIEWVQQPQPKNSKNNTMQRHHIWEKLLRGEHRIFEHANWIIWFFAILFYLLINLKW